MQLRPRQDQPELPTREAAVDCLHGVDSYLRAPSRVTGMEMWRSVVVTNIAITIPKKRLIVGTSTIVPCRAVATHLIAAE
jgi:hypothetical protein